MNETPKIGDEVEFEIEYAQRRGIVKACTSDGRFAFVEYSKPVRRTSRSETKTEKLAIGALRRPAK